MSVHRTAYTIAEGEFGGDECYRLEIDDNTLITFDEVMFAGAMIMLKRNGDGKATIKNRHSIPSQTRQKLLRIANDFERPDDCRCKPYMSGACVKCSAVGFMELNPDVEEEA